MKNVVIAKSILGSVAQNGTLFERGGLKLYGAETSEEMLDLHRQFKAHLIIAEFDQPVMNGAMLCAAIRAEPGLRDVSIIIACEDRDGSQAACLDAGANAVVTRPVDPSVLFSKIAELILVPQRKDMRVLLSVTVDGSEAELPFFATSYNVSVSGMLLETVRDLQVGDLLNCSFRIAHSEIRAACTVVRRDRKDAGRPRYGVRFVNLDTRSIIVIEQYVRSRMKQEGPG